MLTVMGSNGPSGYNILRSLRFRSSASAYLSRTYSSAPSVRTKQTLSFWIKRGSLGSLQFIFDTYDGVSSYSTYVGFTSSDTLTFQFGGAAANNLTTTQVFRDPSAWYAITVVMDTTQATAANRVLIYVNGSQVTAFSAANYPAQNATSQWTYNTANNRLMSQWNTTNFCDGYLAEVNFIDGQALTPSSFGETDSTTGAWVPKKYSGTYGTNGFYLPFTNTTSATTLCYDSSGNGNNWTPNNISTTAGATYDSMTDVPTLTSATAANYATFNPLNGAFGNLTLSAGNLTLASGGNSAYHNCDATISPQGNKGYFEITCTNSPNFQIGVGDAAPNAYNYSSGNVYYIESGGSVRGPTYATTIVSVCTPSFNSNDVVTVAFDFTNPSDKKLWFGRNGTWGDNAGGSAGNPSAGTNATLTSSQLSSTVDYRWYFALNNGAAFAANFGQRPFSYTPPTGFNALNTFNLPTPTIKNGTAYTDSTKYTGNSSTNSVTNAYGFQPGLVWVKSYTDASSQCWVDSVRGTNAYIFSNQTVAEETATNALTAFNSNGFTLGANNTGTYTSGNMNYNGSGYVAWQWAESQTAGFDIVTYTGTGSAQNIAHNLGVAPAFIIVKGRNVGSTNWFMYHQSLGATKYVDFSTGTGGTDSSAWNNTAPTSSVFTVGSSYYTNYSGTTYVAYVWAQIPGFSSFGTYVGNYSNDGPFTYTGFKVKWLMIKNITTGSTSWFNEDGARDPYNAVYKELSPNNPNAQDNIDDIFFDFLSNGFKARNQSYGNNGPSNTYLYAAFAECPFKYANAR